MSQMIGSLSEKWAHIRFLRNANKHHSLMFVVAFMVLFSSISVLCVGPSSYAEEIAGSQNVTEDSNGKTIDITLSDRVDFSLAANTNDATVSSVQITNNSDIMSVNVSNIKVNAASGYMLDSYYDNFAAYDAGSKHFGLAYLENSVAKDLNASEGYSTTLNVGASADGALSFAGKSAVYANDVAASSNTQFANVVLTIDAVPTIAMFDTGQNVNVKLKTLSGQSNPTKDTVNSAITNISRASALPDGFTPSATNTISAQVSIPIYAWFDAGTIYYYSEENTLYLNSDSSKMFYALQELSSLGDISSWDTSKAANMNAMFYMAGHNTANFNIDLSGWDTSKVTNMITMFAYAGHSATTWSIGDLSGWDTSKVTNMASMFWEAGYNATTWSLGDLSGWDTSSVTDMGRMFTYAGYKSTTWSIGDISGWDTSSVTNMSHMFSYAGYSVATFSLDLSGWDTSKVTDMRWMFVSACYNATTCSLDLSGWDTSKVTNMSNMFSYAGESATTWSVTINKTNGDSISNTTSRLYGETTSVYAEPRSGKTFTLAN